MKVREIIEHLQQLDPEKNIWLLEESGINYDIGYCDPLPDRILTKEGREDLMDALQRTRENSLFPDLLPDSSDEIKVGDYLITCCSPLFGDAIDIVISEGSRPS